MVCYRFFYTRLFCTEFHGVIQQIIYRVYEQHTLSLSLCLEKLALRKASITFKRRESAGFSVGSKQAHAHNVVTEHYSCPTDISYV